MYTRNSCGQACCSDRSRDNQERSRGTNRRDEGSDFGTYWRRLETRAKGGSQENPEPLLRDRKCQDPCRDAVYVLSCNARCACLQNCWWWSCLFLLYVV